MSKLYQFELETVRNLINKYPYLTRQELKELSVLSIKLSKECDQMRYDLIMDEDK